MNYPLIGSNQVSHNKIFFFGPSGIAGNTHTWKILSPNPSDGLGQDWLWDPHYEAPDNLQVGHVECVLLAISYQLFSLCISKVFSMLHHCSKGWFHSIECYLIKFQKGIGEGLAAPKLLKRVAAKEDVTFFSRRSKFHIKNKLKSEKFIDKRSL